MPAEYVLPPRAAGSVTLAFAEHGAVSASTGIETLRAASVTLDGALMQGSLTATASVCGEDGGLPMSKSTVAEPPFGTFCVAGPRPWSSLTIVIVTSGVGMVKLVNE